jgi:hypothetical protein
MLASSVGSLEKYLIVLLIFVSTSIEAFAPVSAIVRCSATHPSHLHIHPDRHLRTVA